MPDPAEGPNPFARFCGWLDLPQRHRIAATLPVLMTAAPDLKPDRSKSVLLYKCWRDVFTDVPDYPAQEIGDCTGFGFGHANDLLQTIDAYLGNRDPGLIHRTCTEFHYAEGRKMAGLLGNQDGCFGSAVGRPMTHIGIVPYSSIGGSYSGDRAKEWGRTGAPDDLVAEAANWKLGAAVLLNSTDEMLAALQAGKPCTICTRHGFTTVRDAHGFCERQGSWGHCMFVAGYRASPPGFLICQSWGPDQPTGPLDLDQPPWSFWAHPADMAVIIAEGDSYALSGTPEFGPQHLPAEWSHAA